MVQQFQAKKYKYGAQGNLIEVRQSGHTLKLQWDNLNRLVQSDKNGSITEYGYVLFGRRLFKYNKNQGQLTLFGWEDDLLVWESHRSDQDKGKNYTKHYMYEPNSFVPLLQGGYSHFINLLETPNYEKFKTQAYSINKDPIWKNDARKTKVPLEQLAFYHCDQVGTPQTLSNEKGECVWESELDTWGKVKKIQVENQEQKLMQTNIRFQGQYYDEETGLHYNRYRYYEPHSGRYISKDPIGLFGGISNSAYVSVPNQWVDPLGLQPQFRQPKSSPHCKALLEKVKKIEDELYNKRWPALISNLLGLSERVGPNERLSESVREHRTLINQTDTNLRKWQKRYNEECYEDTCENCSPVGKVITVENVGKVAATGGALYVGYRVVRIIPSLFPLMWPTLPANIIIP